MSDDGCCADTGDCCNDTGGGGWCEPSAPCMDTAPCETYVETTFSDVGTVYINPPYETYDGGYCCEDTTYQPVYSNLSTYSNNNGYITDPCGRAIIIITVIVVTLIMCKLNSQYLYVETLAREYPLNTVNFRYFSNVRIISFQGPMLTGDIMIINTCSQLEFRDLNDSKKISSILLVLRENKR